jgi:hypothetical protein
MLKKSLLLHTCHPVLRFLSANRFRVSELTSITKFLRLFLSSNANFGFISLSFRFSSEFCRTVACAAFSEVMSSGTLNSYSGVFEFGT